MIKSIYICIFKISLWLQYIERILTGEKIEAGRSIRKLLPWTGLERMVAWTKVVMKKVNGFQFYFEDKINNSCRRIDLEGKRKIEIQDGLQFGDQSPLLNSHPFSFLSIFKYLYPWNKNSTSACLSLRKYEHICTKRHVLKYLFQNCL